MEELGDFQIIKTLGHGSLGTAYLAEHRFLKTRSVLKVLPKELVEDQVAFGRFERQIAHLAHLAHPNLLKVQNVSCVDGIYYLVRDYEDSNLKTFLEEKELSEETILSLLRQVASGLDYLHEQSKEISFVHGSLKLSNILLSKDLTITLSDFGLAQIIGQDRIVARSFEEVASLLSKKREGNRHYPFPLEKELFHELSSSFLESFAFLAPEQKKWQTFDKKSR